MTLEIELSKIIAIGWLYVLYIKHLMFMQLIRMQLVIVLSIFVLLSNYNFAEKGSSIYKNKPKERNPFEGKTVEFIVDENDKENADGMKGHLVSTGISSYKPTFCGKYNM